MFNRSDGDETAHCFGKALQARGAGAAHALDRRGGDPDAAMYWLAKIF
jgi:hypothetical protein